MQKRKIKDLMIQISDYATIYEDASMEEAIHALENIRQRFGNAPYHHQSLVVVDSDGNVVGRLSHIDMMRSLEPRYNDMGDAAWFGRAVISKQVMTTLRESYHLWEHPIEEICEAVKDAKVADYMQAPSEGEFVCEDDPINIAMHRVVMGRHHSLLVTKNKKITGILRSTDLFNALIDMITACKGE